MSAEIDARVAEWRRALSRSATVTDADADELEGHLRDQIEDLSRRGLDEEEAFLVAVRRLGATDAITAEFAREHGDRLWKQLVPPTATTLRGHPLLEMMVFALGAAALAQVGRLIAEQTVPADWFARNVAFFLLPVLAAYLVRVRRMTLRAVGILAAITASFVGAQRRKRRPVLIGAGFGLLASAIAGDPMAGAFDAQGAPRPEVIQSAGFQFAMLLRMALYLALPMLFFMTASGGLFRTYMFL